MHAKVMSHAFEDPGRFEVGIDYERFTQLDRIAGNDCVMAFTGAGPGEYACEWQTMAMNYTLQHSVAPDRPIFNSENHLIGDGDTRYIPERYIRTVYWQEAVHGQGATTTWVWERGRAETWQRTSSPGRIACARLAAWRSTCNGWRPRSTR